MESLIKAVRRYPCLWNNNAIEYRDLELKDAAWAEVLKETNLSSVKEVKLKWKKLRDSYRDALKRQSDMLAREPGAAKRNPPWKYMALMHFLQPYMNNRRKPPEPAEPPAPPPDHGAALNGAAAAAEPRSSDDSDSEPESEPRRRSCERAADRKLDLLCKAQTKKMFTEAHYQERRRECPPGAAAGAAGAAGAAAVLPDPLDIFFNSMCQSTKRLPYPTQIKIKKVVFAAVVEAEEALVAEQARLARLWTRRARSESSSEDAADDSERAPS